MNSQEFQEFCKKIHTKYDDNRLTNEDVDSFADVMTNVLGRDDLRAEGTEYASLSARVSHDYENGIDTNPLLARIYELCRMYEMFRFRPLTETELKEEQSESGKNITKKYPVCVSVTDGKKVIASCWWEDLGGMDEIAEKVATISALMPDNANLDDDEIAVSLMNAFSRTDSGLDPLDTEMIEKMTNLVGKNAVPVSSEPSKGIIALDRDGVERNRARQGAKVKLCLEDRTVTMDSYITYGKAFYRSLIGAGQDDALDIVGEVKPEMVSFSFSEAQSACDMWHAVGDAFGIPGSKELVGSKKPLPVS